jgi:threonyl-tRNA synthetase
LTVERGKGLRRRGRGEANVPVMCVVGAEEAQGNTLGVRTYADGELGALPLTDVISRVQTASRDRSGVF